MSDYKTDRYWSDKQKPLASAIMQHNCMDVLVKLQDSTFDEDTKRVLDFAYDTGLGGVSCRARHVRALPKHEFTIRSWRRPSIYSGPDGRNTEYRKIFEEGYCRWFFYYYVDDSEQIRLGREPLLEDVACWYLIDLDIVRCSCLFQNAVDHYNDDGTTGYRAVPISKLIEWHAIIKSSESPSC
jgi:hypothetical protein